MDAIVPYCPTDDVQWIWGSILITRGQLTYALLGLHDEINIYKGSDRGRRPFLCRF